MSNFKSSMFPKAPDAYKTGDFETLGRECEKGLKKCKMPINGGNGVTYWCAPYCDNKKLNLTGTPIPEQKMGWNLRFN